MNPTDRVVASARTPIPRYMTPAVPVANPITIPDAAAVAFGAAWKRISGEGRDYLSVKLDDPSFPAPIYATLVETEASGTYSLIWSRRNGD